MAKVINTVLSLKDDFSSTLKKVEKTATTSVGNIKKAFDSGDTGTAKLSNGLKQTGKEVTKMGQSFMPASLAVGGALGAATKSAADFQQSMANTWSIAKAGNNNSKKAFEELSNAAKAAGQQGYYSATQAADALGYMALAGWDAHKSAKALPDVLNLAAAADMDLAEASDMVTDYMSAFNRTSMTTTQFTDMLSYAQNNSNTTVSLLSEAYKNCAANLNAAGQSAQTTTSILMGLANQGMKGSEAGTQLKAIMRDLTASMDNGSISINNHTIKVQDANGNYRNLLDILTDVDKATKGMGDAEKSAALSAVFTSDSMSGLNTIFSEGIDKIKGYSEALDKSAGSAADSAATKTKTLEGSLTMLKNKLSMVGINLGSVLVPMFAKFAGALVKITDKFTQLSPGTQKIIVVIGAVIAVAGPLLVVIGNVISAIGVIAGVLGAVNLAILGPIAAIAAVIAAVVAFTIFLNNHSEQIMAIVNRAVATVKGWLSAFAGFFKGIWSGITATVAAAVAVIKSKIDGIKQVVNNLKNAASDLVRKWAEAWAKIPQAIKAAYEKVKKWVDKIKNAVKGIPSAIGGKISSAWGAVTGHNATGTPYWTGGLTSINEHGGEIVDLPNGTRIIPHDIAKRQSAGAGVTVNVTVAGNVIGNASYADYLGQMISRKVLKAMANS